MTSGTESRIDHGFPGVTARSSRPSSARTAAWSLAVCGKAFGNTFGTPFHLLEMRAPGGAVPDLHVVAHARDDDLPGELGVLEERGPAAQSGPVCRAPPRRLPRR